MQRDKEVTKQKLIDAVGTVILRDGFSNVGINSVAKEAGVNKVLIYRYFNDLDGLLKAYVKQKDYFTKLSNMTSENVTVSSEDEVAKIGTDIFVGQLKEALKNKELQEILLWELTNKNEVTKAIAEEREAEAVELLRLLEKVVDYSKTDIPAISSILLAGIYYLVLRSRHVNVFNGIDLTTEEGWQRIEKGIEAIISKGLKE